MDAAGEFERLKKELLRMSPEDWDATRAVAIAQRKRHQTSITANLVLRLSSRSDGGGAFLIREHSVTWVTRFHSLNTRYQDELLSIRPQWITDPWPVPKKPSRNTHPLKDAIREAKRENPGASHAELAEATDRILANRGKKFSEICPRQWKRSKSLVSAIADPYLHNAVKTYISKVTKL